MKGGIKRDVDDSRIDAKPASNLAIPGLDLSRLACQSLLFNVFVQPCHTGCTWPVKYETECSDDLVMIVSTR